MEKIKLLVVDDIPQTRKDIIRLLYFEDDMVVVGEAVDGKDALQKIAELQPDVVLMDINMPQMDGIAATERACHMYPHVAVVIISIQGESEYLKKAMVAGARDYLVKPLGSEEMANTIRSVYKQQCLRMPKTAQNQPAASEALSANQQKEPGKADPQVYYTEENISQRASQQLTRHEGHYSGNAAVPPEPAATRQTEPSLQDRVQAIYRQRDAVTQDGRHHQVPDPARPETEQHYSHAKTQTESGQQPVHTQTPAPQDYSEYQNRPTQEYRQPEYSRQNSPGMAESTGYHARPQQYEVIHPVTPQQIRQQSIQQRVDSPRHEQERPKPVQHLSAHPAGEIRIERQSGQRQTVSVPDEKPLGFVTVVFCGKGGVGKTTIATNLAVALVQQEKKKVALVDYDLQFGDISVLLNLADGNNISDLVQEPDEITDELLENYMIRHFTGIDILPAPLFPQDAEYITADHTDTILKHLKKIYDYVIVDTAGMFNEINLSAMDLADQILLVTTRDIVTIKNTKTSLNILESLNYRDKIRVVLNRSDQDLGVEVADLEKGLEITVAHQISSDEKAVISSINKGVPVVVSHLNSELSKSFKRLCERMTNGGKHTVSKENLKKSIITRMFSL
ncbi:MAG: response regulator [Bacillota bacterium]|nr:response regulator [Bacillota bacterium]MDW7683947.1 response regulator [Bacillota bacterium]